MARRRTPTAIRIVQNNPQKRPLNPDEPKPQRGTPTIPRYIERNREASWAWYELAEQLDRMGVLTLADRKGLELLADSYAEWRAARAVVLEKGATYETESESGTMHRPRPEVAIAADAWRRVRSLLTEFGLTPSARAKLKAGPEAPRDPLGEFLGRGRGG